MSVQVPLVSVQLLESVARSPLTVNVPLALLIVLDLLMFKALPVSSIEPLVVLLRLIVVLITYPVNAGMLPLESA